MSWSRCVSCVKRAHPSCQEIELGDADRQARRVCYRPQREDSQSNHAVEIQRAAVSRGLVNFAAQRLGDRLHEEIMMLTKQLDAGIFLRSKGVSQI